MWRFGLGTAAPTPRHTPHDASSPGPLRARIAGMDCGSCALTIEDGLRQLPGARRVSVDFTTESLEIEGEVSRASVEHRLRQLGYRLADQETQESMASATGAPSTAGGVATFFVRDAQQRVALAATLAILAATLAAVLAPAPATAS